MKSYVHINDRQLRPDESALSRNTPASWLVLYIEVIFTLPRKTWFLDFQTTRQELDKEFCYKFRVFCMLLLAIRQTKWPNLERILDGVIHLVNVTRDLDDWCNPLKLCSLKGLIFCNSKCFD